MTFTRYLGTRCLEALCTLVAVASGTKRPAGVCREEAVITIDGADMTFLPQTFRGSLIATASALALALCAGGALAQGYSGQNGGSSTMQGQGTRGESNVDGSGVGGPRDKMQQQPYSTTNPSATRPGIATAPTSPTSPRSNSTTRPRSDTGSPNVNPGNTR